MNGNVCNESRGFTLIELMIVLAVAAIILSIAIPAFTEQMRKSRRSEAISGLQQLALKMERWRADNPSYANSNPASANYPSQAATDNYAFAVTAASPTTFTLQATRQGAQTSDATCGNFTFQFGDLDNNGATPATTVKSAAAAGCWND